jgi:hypothetical protein
MFKMIRDSAILNPATGTSKDISDTQALKILHKDSATMHIAVIANVCPATSRRA